MKDQLKLDIEKKEFKCCVINEVGICYCNDTPCKYRTDFNNEVKESTTNEF